MYLLFCMLSRLVMAFLPRSKHLLISWLQSQSAVILEPPKINSVTVSTVSPSICHEVMGPEGRGDRNSLWYSCLENPSDGGTWWAAIYGVSQSWWLLLSNRQLIPYYLGFPGGSDSKESACNAGDLGSILGLGRSPGEENSNSLQMGKQWLTLFWGAPKSLQMVTAAMKLKDACSLEGKL